MTESESICKECGHPTEWAQDIGSAVCTQCGTLADPSQQSALTSAQESFPRDVPSYAPPTTLKSIRRNAAWDLPGQGSDSRNDRNKVLSLSLLFPLSQIIALSSLSTISFAHFPTVWDIMVWQPAHKLFSTRLCCALP
jgi:transcription factor IIIB 90 kDa subunit